MCVLNIKVTTNTSPNIFCVENAIATPAIAPMLISRVVLDTRIDITDVVAIKYSPMRTIMCRASRLYAYQGWCAVCLFTRYSQQGTWRPVCNRRWLRGKKRKICITPKPPRVSDSGHWLPIVYLYYPVSSFIKVLEAMGQCQYPNGSATLTELTSS